METVISWFSIPSHDFDRAVAFYEAILDTKLDVMGEGDDRMGAFRGLDFPGANGGVSGDSTFKPTADGVRIYLTVDIDAVLSRVESAGGKIVTGKSSLGEHGFYAFILDTEGNQIGLHSL